MRNTFRLFIIAVLSSVSAFAQVSTGTPTFSSMTGGPFDTINLGNLNAYFSIPILTKSGRGIRFTYNLAYNSSIWSPVTSSGSTFWQPSATWGWAGLSSAGQSELTYSMQMTTTYCYMFPRRFTYYNYTFTNIQYIDPKGVDHPFGGYLTYIEGNHVSGCPTPGESPSTGLNLTATDSSGYKVVVNAIGDSLTIDMTDAGGNTITPPIVSNPSPASYWAEDANGNEITVASGQYTDTTGNVVLGIVGTAPSPTILSYTAPSGGTASYTVNYTQYTVATNFGFSGITDYGPTSVPLVSSIVLPDSTQYTFTYEVTPGSCTPLSGTYSSNCVTGRLAGITLPTGGTVNYTYTGGPGSTGIFSDGSTAGLTRTLSPGGTWTYARALVSGTPGPGSTWKTTVTDPTTPTANQTVSQFSEDATTSGTGTIATYSLYETQRQVYQGSSSSGTLLGTTLTCYNGNYSSCVGASVSSPISQTDTYSELPSGSTRLSEIIYNGSYTASGLVSQDSEYDYGVTLGAAPGTAHLVRETVIGYATLSNGIDNKPSSVGVYDWTSGSSSTLSYAVYSYDGTAVAGTSGTPQHSSISGSRGNLTTVATQANSSGATWLYNTFTYYDTGNLNTSTGASTSSGTPGPTTTYNYGSGSCGNSFATTISEPLGLSRTTAWNCTGGVATSVTDENSQTVTTHYTDPYFWRPANVYDRENNETTLTYSGQTAVESTLSFNSGNSVVDARATTDGFGRPILNQRLQGPSSSSYDTTETDYNIIGLTSRITMPFNASAGGTSSTAPGLHSSYDALGRLLSETDASGGTTSYTYSNNDVLIVLSGGAGTQAFEKQLEFDGLGRLTSVCEISTSLSGVGACGQTTAQTGYWTKYTYDALGHLLTVTQNAQASSSNRQSRTYFYDLLGRITSGTNPETGTVTYVYDSVSPCADGTNYLYPGNLVERTDNAGNSTCYAYDALNRMIQAGDSAASNTILKQFTYDSESTYPSGISVSNGNTRLVEAKTVNTSSPSTTVTDEFFSYSPRGELSDFYESTPHSGGFYHTSAFYWASGSLASLSGIPSVPTIYYGAGGGGLDGEGRYTQVSASTSPNPVTSVTYSTSSTTNPLGSLIGVTYGSADSDSFTFDPNTGRGLTYTYSVNGSTDAGTTSWNANGTLASLSITDNITGTSDSQSCSYAYDDLERAAGVNCGSIWQQTFTYDAFGNINKSGSLSFAPNYTTSSPTNQFSSIPGTSGPYYDSNGNLVKDNLNTYTWDPNWGNMTSVNTGATTVTAVYDARGQVVEQDSGSSYAEVLYTPAGKAALVNGTTLVKAFVGLPGGGAAVYNSSGLAYYRHADWLGSSRLASTQARGLYSSTAYAPFGEQYATSGAADASFMGQNSDTVSSLYDFTFRRLSSSQGRWISPDPAGMAAANPANPQTWNRYAYVINNPMANIDPSGLACVTSDEDGNLIYDVDDGNGGCPNGGVYIPGSPQDVQNAMQEGYITIDPVCNCYVQNYTDSRTGLPYYTEMGPVNPAIEAISAIVSSDPVAQELIDVGANAAEDGLPLIAPEALELLPLESVAVAADAADLTAETELIGPEGPAQGPFSTYINTTFPGSDYTNISTNVSADEFQTNLMSNGYNIQSSGISSNGSYTVLGNGTDTYTIYTRTSTGESGAQYFGGDPLKFSLGVTY